MRTASNEAILGVLQTYVFSSVEGVIIKSCVIDLDCKKQSAVEYIYGCGSYHNSVLRCLQSHEKDDIIRRLSRLLNLPTKIVALRLELKHDKPPVIKAEFFPTLKGEYPCETYIRRQTSKASGV